MKTWYHLYVSSYNAQKVPLRNIQPINTKISLSRIYEFLFCTFNNIAVYVCEYHFEKGRKPFTPSIYMHHTSEYIDGENIYMTSLYSNISLAFTWTLRYIQTDDKTCVTGTYITNNTSILRNIRYARSIVTIINIAWNTNDLYKVWY